MLVSQVLQKMVTDINRIIKEDCSIWNTEGVCLASTVHDTADIEKDVKSLIQEVDDRSVQVNEGTACFVIRYEGEAIYIFAVHNVMDNIAIMGKLCVNLFENMMHVYERKVDRNRFFQQLILDNLLLVDVHSQAKKMNLNINEKRIIFIISIDYGVLSCVLHGGGSYKK